MKHLSIKVILPVLACSLLLIACHSGVRREKAENDNSWLEEMTINKLQEGYRNGKFSVADVVSAYLGRIIAIDVDGPSLNSIIEINPEAM
ncbi:MAG: hypothetical protein ABSG89_08530, partial [Bacteroidales bacterium]